jgi:hypothetical protein
MLLENISTAPSLPTHLTSDAEVRTREQAGGLLVPFDNNFNSESKTNSKEQVQMRFIYKADAVIIIKIKSHDLTFSPS